MALEINTRHSKGMMANIYMKGDPFASDRSVKEIGEARVLAVEALRDAPKKLSRDYLTTLLESLKNNTTQSVSK